MKNCFTILFLLVFILPMAAQNATRRDSLQGGLRPERTDYDVQRYDLNITVNPDKKYISGYNDITFKVVNTTTKIQVDLFENMQADSIVFDGKKLDFNRDYAAVFINFPEKLAENSEHKIRFYYSGNPIIARNAPWDGGFVFSKDSNNKPWIGVAVQGTGASLWYPVKDGQTDEPDRGATIKVAVPNGLMDVSNGRLTGSTDLGNGYTRWDWEVVNPINNYDITVNIADYAHIHDNLNGLDLDYYVLKENKEKATKQFEEVKPMLQCFQEKFGPYPFYEDGYKLVETPYLGMEHQSAVAYGNQYKMGYLGGDLSGTGIGMKFDFIIVHESGHEWFGNSITSSDIADMWIHEAFTTYAESVYVECRFGYEAAQKYVNGEGRNVFNDKPVIGIFGVNKEGSGDMYFKGALVLNTIRHIINDDAKWWEMLHNFAVFFHKSVINSQSVVNYFSTKSGISFTPVFEQYLNYTSIPLLQLEIRKGLLFYRWQTDVQNFEMPVDISAGNKTIRLHPTNTWKQKNIDGIHSVNDVQVATDKFYINVQKL